MERLQQNKAGILMTRQQAINIFINTDVKKECNLCQSKLLQKTEHSLDVIVKEIEEQIALFYKQIVMQQKQNKKPAVNYIQFSFLLSSIKQHRVQILAEAFSDEWYFGDNICETKISIPYLETELCQLYEILLQKRKRFIGKVTKTDVERIMLGEWKAYQEIEEALLKYALEISLDEKELEYMKKAKDIAVFSGEYRGEFHQIYAINEMSKRLREVFYGLFSNETV